MKRIFVAGATGALGSRVVPLLVELGHQVTGVGRTPEKPAILPMIPGILAIRRVVQASRAAKRSEGASSGARSAA